MISSIKRGWQTIKHLKFIQVRYQVYYRLRNRLIRPQQLAGKSDVASTHHVTMDKALISLPESYHAELNKFVFLNQEKEFGAGPIDWNYGQLGKLWTYNLNYFDFLNQQRSKDEGLCLIRDFISGYDAIKDGLEPYPISLRGINWIKFLSEHDCEDQEISKSLWAQYNILSRSLEYHLLANHLLENAFSLLFGSYFFRNERFYLIADKILKEELKEQINQDGGHYERSPMYHQILLYRLLDCLNLVKNNLWKDKALMPLLEEKASLMLTWLEKITFSNGDIPMVQDAAFHIAPSTQELKDYAEALGVGESDSVSLSDSGYRKFDTAEMELFFNVGQITPTYQPGHAHSDELQFLLYFQGEPIIVDTGVSTYESNTTRDQERSTAAHNCISIEGHNSSEVWGGFRVGRRATVTVISENKGKLIAAHDGFYSLGMQVQRTFQSYQKKIVIEDVLDINSEVTPVLRIHFHPDVKVQVRKHTLFVKNLCIDLTGYVDISCEKYKFAAGFNKYREATMVRLKPGKTSKMVFSNAS